ncbi:hypothetical protein ABW21_db0207172 [Orbilia brochopaga]|nr:hypothetical protein ABW21_db0207172 [Drechslerella brochopaga]
MASNASPQGPGPGGNSPPSVPASIVRDSQSSGPTAGLLDMEVLRYVFSQMDLIGSSWQPRRPDLRSITRVSRLLDNRIHLDPAQPAYLARLLTALGMRKWWHAAIVKFIHNYDPRVRPGTHGQVSKQTGHPHATLFDLPNEILATIIDSPELSDVDRLRFGSTCALIMANTIPILYKYALLRYPVRNLDMNQNYQYVGHFVRELIIHAPTNVAPVSLESEYIPLYDILNRMTNLRSVTLYLDAPISPTEVASLLRYLLATKSRLQNITLDITNLTTAIYAYDSRTIYDLRRAIDAVATAAATASGLAAAVALPGAQLQSVSLAIKEQQGAYVMHDVLQVFAGHCSQLMYLRALPRMGVNEELNLTTLRSPALQQLTWVVTRPSNDLFAVALRAAARPDTLQEARIVAIMTTTDVLIALRQTATFGFAFQNARFVQINQVSDRPSGELIHDVQLRRFWEQIASKIIRQNPTLDTLVLAEQCQENWGAPYRCCANRVEGDEIKFQYGFRFSHEAQ